MSSHTMELVIVEDDPIYQDLYLSFIDGMDCYASFASTVAEASQLCLRLRANVIILDFYLPDGDSFNVIKEVKLRLEAQMPFIIVVTGSLDDELEKRLLDEGVDRVLNKPEGLVELRRVLEQLVTV